MTLGSSSYLHASHCLARQADGSAARRTLPQPEAGLYVETFISVAISNKEG